MASLHQPMINPVGQVAVRVAIVEDNEDDRELLVRQLRKGRMDEHVKFLSDGKEAFNFLKALSLRSRFAILSSSFLDLKLPGMNGVDLLREIRQMPHVRHTPVIVMTSSLSPGDFEVCQNLTVSAYIPKPITFDLFSKSILGLPHMPTFRSE